MSQPLTRGGTPWHPEYLDAIASDVCIGCGRCFKVCPRHVLKPAGMSEDGELLDFDDDDAFRKIMTVEDADDCTGCGACLKVCSTTAMSFARAP
jgi:Nif-specific ferredoxin III